MLSGAYQAILNRRLRPQLAHPLVWTGVLGDAK